MKLSQALVSSVLTLSVMATAPACFAEPTPQMAFELLASEPLGETLIVAFLSSDCINFYQQSVDDRDENGNITVAHTSHWVVAAFAP